MVYPECARGGGVSHLLAEKRGVSFTLLKKMHENTIFSPIKGGYAGSATGRSITATCKIRPKSFFLGLLDMFLTCQHGH